MRLILLVGWQVTNMRDTWSFSLRDGRWRYLGGPKQPCDAKHGPEPCAGTSTVLSGESTHQLIHSSRPFARSPAKRSLFLLAKTRPLFSSLLLDWAPQ